jgi:hypothetical protein
MRNFLIGALIVALAALAYFYWYDRNTISIPVPDAPAVRPQ